MSTSRPWVQWWPLDILNDPKYMVLSRSAKLTYRELLDRLWLSGCALKNDPRMLSTLAGISFEAFESDWDEIQNHDDPCFVDHPNKAGYITNRRMLKEWEKATRDAEQSRINGKKGGRPTKQRTEYTSKITNLVAPGLGNQNQEKPELEPESELETNYPSENTPLPPTGAALAKEPEQSEHKAKKATAKDRRAEMFGQVQAAYPTAFNRHLASETTGRNAYTADLQAHENHGFATEGDLHEHVLAQIRKASNSERWLEDDGKFIPGIGKFLKNRLWRGSFEAPDALFTPKRGTNVTPGLGTDNSLPARFGPA